MDLEHLKLNTLARRATAAVRLLRNGDLDDPALILSYVVWPKEGIKEEADDRQEPHTREVPETDIYSHLP